jgi:SAM-dependent methyltransferase
LSASEHSLVVLNNPIVWEISRVGLDLIFGLYRKRVDLLHKWGVLDSNPSILDIGCGIGQYSTISKGRYLGVDLNEPYINYAMYRYKRQNSTFKCTNVTQVLDENLKFDIVLMVDFLHRIKDLDSIHLLGTAARLAKQYVISFEPILAQSNPVGRWIIDHDRGDYIRPLGDHLRLFSEAQLTCTSPIRPH